MDYKQTWNSEHPILSDQRNWTQTICKELFVPKYETMCWRSGKLLKSYWIMWWKIERLHCLPAWSPLIFLFVFFLSYARRTYYTPTSNHPLTKDIIPPLKELKSQPHCSKCRLQLRNALARVICDCGSFTWKILWRLVKRSFSMHATHFLTRR